MAKAHFIEAMECLPITKIPEGTSWRHELKLDGYRMEAVRVGAKTTLYSRRENVLTARFPHIASALDYLPAETVLDGELVALDSDGRPNFSLLQNFRSAASSIRYYVFDILMHQGKDLTGIPLSERRAILDSIVKEDEYVEPSALSPLSGPEMLKFVKQRGLEGVISKRIDSIYEPGKRSGLWTKHRVNLGQEFVIDGYLPSNLGVDSLVVGFYRSKDLIYASRVRAGFVPSTRRAVLNEIKDLATSKCPFANLSPICRRKRKVAGVKV
jgi:ATP-dependent DNA ligase